MVGLIIIFLVPSIFVNAYHNRNLRFNEVLKDPYENAKVNRTAPVKIAGLNDEKRSFYSDGPSLNSHCENVHKYSIFGNFLKIASNNPLKEELLKEFLCIKYFQYFEMINYLSIGAFTHSKQDLKVLSISPEQLIKSLYRKNLKQHGTDSCSLENVAIDSFSNHVPVCPWHWLILVREDRYPFQLPVAKCNCENCQARTLFDNDRKRLSKCNNNFSLKPVLHREYNVDVEKNEEAWIFSLEEVPVSCSCSVKLNPW